MYIDVYANKLIYNEELVVCYFVCTLLILISLLLLHIHHHHL